MVSSSRGTILDRQTSDRFCLLHGNGASRNATSCDEFPIDRRCLLDDDDYQTSDESGSFDRLPSSILPDRGMKHGNPRVAIAGGGIAGLALALNLHARGVSCRV